MLVLEIKEIINETLPFVNILVACFIIIIGVICIVFHDDLDDIAILLVNLFSIALAMAMVISISYKSITAISDANKAIPIVAKYIRNNSSEELNSILSKAKEINKDEVEDVMKAIDKSIGNTQLQETQALLTDKGYSQYIIQEAINSYIKEISVNGSSSELANEINSINKQENKNDI